MEDLRTAALYAKTLNGVEIDPAAYDVPSRGGEYYMAPQVVLTQLLKPFLLDFTIDDTGYNDLYFRMEVIVGAAVFDACGPNGLDLKYSVASNWVGVTSSTSGTARRPSRAASSMRSTRRVAVVAARGQGVVRW